MRLGIIDLGTNSIRFDVHQVLPDGSTVRLHRERLMVRLGYGVFLRGKLDRIAINRTLVALESFKIGAERMKVDKIVAFATSALREARDRDRLIREALARTGIRIKVISGETEAEMIANGILRNEKSVKGLIGLVDIGGGSTEISICRGKKLIHMSSFDLGSARLYQMFFRNNWPLKRQNSATPSLTPVIEHIRDRLEPFVRDNKWPTAKTYIGSSGTIKALSRIIRSASGKRVITRSLLQEHIQRMLRMTRKQLQDISGLESQRIDIILAGAILLKEIMVAFRIPKIRPTDFALRDGLLGREIENIRKSDRVKFAVQPDEIAKEAAILKADTSHSKNVRRLSGELFDHLKTVHRLKREWRELLEVAALLHDTGEIINSVDHDLHSYYLVMSMNLFGLEPWRREFVAELCLWHKNGKAKKSDTPFSKNEKHWTAFLKLLSILRIADALDRGRKARVQVEKVHAGRHSIELRLKCRSTPTLELLRAEQKKELFEEVFRKTLIIRH